jgi:hypothetical protein
MILVSSKSLAPAGPGATVDRMAGEAQQRVVGPCKVLAVLLSSLGP